MLRPLSPPMFPWPPATAADISAMQQISSFCAKACRQYRLPLPSRRKRAGFDQPEFALSIHYNMRQPCPLRFSAMSPRWWLRFRCRCRPSWCQQRIAVAGREKVKQQTQKTIAPVAIIRSANEPELLFLIPIALFLGLLGLVAFLWSLKNGQYDDLDGAASRILLDGLSHYQNSSEIIDIRAGWPRYEQIPDGVECRPCMSLSVEPPRHPRPLFCRRKTVEPSAKAPALSSPIRRYHPCQRPAHGYCRNNNIEGKRQQELAVQKIHALAALAANGDGRLTT